jgi:hypothetical protein
VEENSEWTPPAELAEAARKAIELLDSEDPRFEPVVSIYDAEGIIENDLDLPDDEAGIAQVRAEIRAAMRADLDRIRQVAEWARNNEKSGVAYRLS